MQLSALHAAPCSQSLGLPGEPRGVSSAFAIWPAGLTWNDALAYGSLSPSQLRKWEKSGALTFKRVGRHGARVVLRSQLDNILAGLFGKSSSIEEDFDFG